MLPKCTWLNLSVLFAKDVVGTGRTMKALLSSIEKYKPNMVKVARYVRYTSSLFLSFQTSPRGMLTQDAVFRECCLFQTSDLLLWGVMV